MMDDSQLTKPGSCPFAGSVSAALQAARVWRSLRDREQTIQAHKQATQEAQRDPALRREETAIEDVLSSSVLDAMAERVAKFWSEYHGTLLDPAILPVAELDQATDELILHVFKELDRIRELHGSIPDKAEKVSEMWASCRRI